MEWDGFWEGVRDRRRRQVLRIAAAQWWLCFYCSCAITPENVIREHRIPRCKGGKNGNSNIVASCVGCDKKKADRPDPPENYLWQKRRQYFRSLGLCCNKPNKKWREFFPNFGMTPDGQRLWAPQYGIM